MQALHEQILEENAVIRLQLAAMKVTSAFAGTPTGARVFSSRMAPAENDCGPSISRVPPVRLPWQVEAPPGLVTEI